MAAIDRAAFDAYASAVSKARGIAADARLAEALAACGEGMLSARDEAARAPFRDRASALLLGAVDSGSAAARSAADSFFRSSVGREPRGRPSPADPARAESRIRYVAARLFETGNASEFASRAQAWADLEIAYACAEAMAGNVRAARIGGARGLRYAHVPTAPDPCPFCCMLASRGFAFHGKGDPQLHHGCRCVLVPGFEGDTLDGYDPKGMYARYLDCRRTCGSDDDDDVLAEMATRDRRWLYDETSGVARLHTTDIEDHERKAYEVLTAHGFSFDVNAVKNADRRDGKSSPDVTMGEARWEMKCPDGSNERKTIGRNINKAAAQMRNANPPADRVRVILSCLRTDIPDDKIEYQVKRKLRDGTVDEIIVIYGETDIRRYK